jgi:renalase
VSENQRSCIIVGAGLSGLLAASTLQREGWDVTVVDKGRDVGGRMATRRIGRGNFDYGAQFFTVRGERFAGLLEDWRLRGLKGSTERRRLSSLQGG